MMFPFSKSATSYIEHFYSRPSARLVMRQAEVLR